MINKVKITITLLLGISIALSASAQRQTLELDLKKAVEIALDDNPTIRIADMEIEKQRYAKRETIGGFLPSVNVSGTYSRAIVKNEMSKGMSFESDNTVMGQASISLPLFAPALYKSLQLNKHQMEAAVESARGSRITLIHSVKSAYYNVLLAQQNLELLLARKEVLDENLKNIRSMYQSDMVAEYDLVAVETQIAGIRPNILAVENAIKSATKLLSMYLDLPDDVELRLTDRLNNYISNVESDDDRFTSDLAENSDLRNMDIQLNIMGKQLGLMRTQRMPVVAAFGNLSIMGRDPVNFDMTGPLLELLGGIPGIGGMLPAPPPPPSNDFMWSNPISVGVQVSIPLFAGNSRINKERQMKKSIAQVQLQREYTENMMKVQLQNMISNILTSREIVGVSKSAVDLAERAYSINKSRYESGMGTILELNNAELSLAESRLNYTQSVYNYLTAKADYEKMVGLEK